jgi:hypothetical protein
MRHREGKLGFGTEGNTEGLIVGVRVNDGIHFPDYARNSQSADMEQFFFDEQGFTNSPLYIEFQKKVAEIAKEVARVVNNAPAWSEDWLTAAWVDDVVAEIQMGPKPKASQPLLG